MLLSSVVSKQQLPYEHHVSFGFGAESGNVEEIPVRPRPDVETFCTVYKGILEQHREENPEQGWSKDTALLYSTADREGIGGGPIEADRTLHVLVKGGDDRQELWRAANLLEDLEEPTSAHRVNSFGEVHEGKEEWLLLSTLLLQLTEGEDHVHCGPPGSEATL